MCTASDSSPPTNCLPAPPSVIWSEIILTVPYMGLGVPELKLMGKYPFHLQTKWALHLGAIPRCDRKSQAEGPRQLRMLHVGPNASILLLDEQKKMKWKEILEGTLRTQQCRMIQNYPDSLLRWCQKTPTFWCWYLIHFLFSSILETTRKTAPYPHNWKQW